MRFSGPIAPIRKKHPLTGEVIEPVGIVNNRLIWPILGGDSSNDDDDDDDDDKKGTGDSGAGDGGDDGGDSGTDDDVVTKAELDKIISRMKAADVRADKAEAALKKIEDAKKDDLTKAQERTTELEEEITGLQSTVRTLRLQNAFLTANKHNWHDPDVALRIAQDQGYLDEDVTDDDGKVDKVRLGKALDRLAKEKPFLVNTGGKDDDDEPGEPSGEPAGGRSNNGKDDKAKREQLKRRFPILNR